MIKDKLTNLLTKRRCTLLGVGPMSVNCVDAAIDLSNDHRIPLLMIASRRQIDSAEFGGGYVNDWTTDEYAQYVTTRDKRGQILLARDHGGPWQNTNEVDKKLSLRMAMESAKMSYRADINAGFQLIHIDPSVDIYGTPDVDEVLNRLFELYEFCWREAKRAGKEILFEIGTEEQSGSTNSQEELEYTLNAVEQFCKKYNLPTPTFVVIQCGTRVMEMRNVGSFDSPIRIANEIPAEIQLPKMIEICNRYGIFMKEHNTDYLSDDAIQWHPRLGIHAANVAPEFGVVETKALVSLLESNGLQPLAERFLAISYESRKWEKWMLPDTTASDRDRSFIAGHYVFSNPEVIEIKLKASTYLHKNGINLEDYLKRQIKQAIMRYLVGFRLVRRGAL